MNKLKEFLKFRILPKKLYLRLSAANKSRRAVKKGETELWLLPDLVDGEKDAIDVGANTGLYTYYLSRLARHVYAFEPHRVLAGFLDKATGDNVTVLNKAVSDSSGKLPFYVPVRRGRKLYNVASLDEAVIKDRDHIVEEIETVSLDQLGYENIGFIKIDVEGHELSVLKGAVKTIGQQRPTLLIEILDLAGHIDTNETYKFIRSLDYEVYAMQEGKLVDINLADPDKLGRNYICKPA